MEHSILAVVLALAAYFDYREDKIPNRICFAGSVGGLLTVLFQQGLPAGAERCAWALGIFLCLFPLWRLHIMGAGDIKLIMTGAILLGTDSIRFLLASGVCIGLHALFIMISRKNYYKRMALFFRYVLDCWTHKELEPYPFEAEKDAADGGIRISYGLFVGHLLAMMIGMYHL